MQNKCSVVGASGAITISNPPKFRIGDAVWIVETFYNSEVDKKDGAPDKYYFAAQTEVTQEVYHFSNSAFWHSYNVVTDGYTKYFNDKNVYGSFEELCDAMGKNSSF